MNRFTEEHDVRFGVSKPYKDIMVEDRDSADKKLFELENIEEKQGIDLITLFKALENGFYYYKDGKIAHTSDEESYISLSAVTSPMCIQVQFGNLITAYFYFQDLGITWALTKEELEPKKLDPEINIGELIEKMYKQPIYKKRGEFIHEKDYTTDKNILYNFKNNTIEIYEIIHRIHDEYLFFDKLIEIHDKYLFVDELKVEDYGQYWAFTKEELENANN